MKKLSPAGRILSFVGFLALLGTSGPTGAQGLPSLVRDINVTSPNPGSSPSKGALLGSGGGACFAATISYRGRELFRWIPPIPGALVREISPGSSGSDPAEFISLGGVVYFVATEPGLGRELWRTDGTYPQTLLVRDINPGAGSSSPSGLFSFNNRLWFAADNGVHGAELWTSDGTAAGTVMVKDINPGSSSSNPSGFAAMGGRVYFIAGTAEAGYELWSSDGTAASTAMVREINPGPGSGTPTSSPLVPFGSRIYFAGNDGTHGSELWSTDGTAAGTAMVVDLNAGIPSSSPMDLTVLGSELVFAATGTGVGREVFKYSGGSVSLLRDINPGSGYSYPGPFAPLGTRLFFPASDGVAGNELWSTDGTTAGTVLVRDVNPGSGSSNPGDLTVLGSVLLFRANDGTTGAELWRSDGTSAGTSLLADLNPAGSGAPRNFTQATPSICLFAADDGVRGEELWRTDGTGAGTVLAADINTSTGAASSNPAMITEAGGTAFFTADDGVSGVEPWRTDGTAAGTFQVRDIRGGAASSNPRALTPHEGSLYFVAHDGTSERLWRTTASGAEPVGTPALQRLTPASHGGSLYLGSIDPVAGSYLHRGIGSPPGSWTLLYSFSFPFQSEQPRSFTPLGSLLFFSAVVPFQGVRLWRTDGTPSGTIRVPEALPEPILWPEDLTSFRGRIFFTATTSSNGRELFATDAAGAFADLVKDINPGTASSDPAELTVVGDTLYFAAHDGVAGRELWKTDGTAAGTVRVQDIHPGSGGSDPTSLTAFGGTLLFCASDAAYGREPMRSDGTPAGTVLLKDVQTGIWSSMSNGPDQIWTLPGANRALLAASDGLRGSELWITDGTTAGTRLFSDIFPGSVPSTPAKPGRLGAQLLFAATHGTGRELYKLAAMPASIPYGSGCPGAGGLVPQIAAVGAPALGNPAYGLEVRSARPNASAWLIMGFLPASTPLGGGCALLVSLVPAYLPFPAVTNASGTALVSLPVPAEPTLIGVSLYWQYGVLDPANPLGLAFTGGLQSLLGQDA